jgi:hypothetical protein
VSKLGFEIETCPQIVTSKLSPGSAVDFKGGKSWYVSPKK